MSTEVPGGLGTKPQSPVVLTGVLSGWAISPTLGLILPFVGRECNHSFARLLETVTSWDWGSPTF